MKSFNRSAGVLLLVIGILTCFPVSAITPEESKAVARKLRVLSQAEALPFEMILRTAKISPGLRKPNLFQHGCRIALLMFGGRLAMTEAAERISQLPEEQQVFLFDTLVQGRTVPEVIIEQQKNAEPSGSSEILRAVEWPAYWPKPKFAFSIEELISQTNQTLSDFAGRELRPTNPQRPRILFDKLSFLNGKLGFSYSLIYPDGEVLSLEAEQVTVDEDMAPGLMLDIIVASIFHSLLLDETAMRQEINALRYSIKKLSRVAAPEVKGQLNGLLAQLPETTATGFLSSARARGQALVSYLSVKRELITLAQLQQSAMARDRRDASIAGTKKPTDPLKVKFVQGEANNRFRPAGGRRLRPGGYYYPYYRSQRPQASTESDDSDTMLTLSWMMNPHYMLTHPWFWGTRDGSPLSVFMLMGAMEDNSARAHQAEKVFDPEAVWEMPVFNQPIEPIFLENREIPVVDPWNAAPDRLDVLRQSFDPDGSPTWERVDGASVLVDDSDVGRQWRDFAGEAQSSWSAGSELQTTEVSSSDSTADDQWQSGDDSVVTDSIEEAGDAEVSSEDEMDETAS